MEEHGCENNRPSFDHKDMYHIDPNYLSQDDYMEVIQQAVKKDCRNIAFIRYYDHPLYSEICIEALRMDYMMIDTLHQEAYFGDQ